MPLPLTTHFKLTALYREGQLKEALHILLPTHNPPEDSSIYLQLLQTCILKNALSLGKNVHSFITHRRWVFGTRTTHNKLIYMYVKCGSLVDARKVFDQMKEHDRDSWNKIIVAYRRHGWYIHQSMKDRGILLNVVVASALVYMYAKFRKIDKARELFDRMPRRDVV